MFGTGGKKNKGLFLKNPIFGKGRQQKTDEKRDMRSICACGSDKRYFECCYPHHAGTTYPETPIELLRARYSAFVNGVAEFIIKSTDPGADDFVADPKSEEFVDWLKSIQQFCGMYEFEGMRVIKSGELVNGAQEITFRVDLLEKGDNVGFTERALFVRGKDKEWKYRDGKLLEFDVVED